MDHTSRCASNVKSAIAVSAAPSNISATKRASLKISTSSVRCGGPSVGLISQTHSAAGGAGTTTIEKQSRKSVSSSHSRITSAAKTKPISNAAAAVAAAGGGHHSNNRVKAELPTTVPKDDPISLDLTAYDEYGNRTVPIYRKSVKLKFDTKDKMQEFLQTKRVPVNGLLFNYHSSTSLNDQNGAPPSWKYKLLDDDVITAVTNMLQGSSKDSLFVNPCLTQCILFAKVKHVALFLDPLKCKKYSNVFFVLNDSRKSPTMTNSDGAMVDGAIGGGTNHWSLLVYNEPSRRLFHFDSMHNTNYKVAYEMAQRLCEYLNVWAITDVYCEQQTNSTDCGYYVIDNMLKILYILKHATQTPFSQINRLPSLIDKTKNFVVNVYLRTKAPKK